MAFLRALRLDRVLGSRPLASLVHATPTATPSALSAPLGAGLRSLAARARDPERPKKPLTSWLCFLQDFRKQRPELKHKEVLQVASVEWKKLPDAQRVPFASKYDAEKAEYQRALKAYVDTGKAAAWKRDPEKPKRPPTSFMLFAAEFRAAHPELKMVEQSKQAGAKWKAMSVQQKEPYEKRVAEDWKAYTDAMSKYKASGLESEWKAKVGLDKADAKKEKEKAAKLKEAKKAKIEKVKMRALKAKEAKVAKQSVALAKATARLEKEKAKRASPKSRPAATPATSEA